MKRVLATVLLSGGLFYSNVYAFLFQQILEETTDRQSFAIRVISEKLSAANDITAAAAEDAVGALFSTVTTMDDVINYVPEDSASVFERTWGNIKASNAFPPNWYRMFLGSLLGGGSKTREVSYLGYMHRFTAGAGKDVSTTARINNPAGTDLHFADPRSGVESGFLSNMTTGGAYAGKNSLVSAHRKKEGMTPGGGHGLPNSRSPIVEAYGSPAMGGYTPTVSNCYEITPLVDKRVTNRMNAIMGNGPDVSSGTVSLTYQALSDGWRNGETMFKFHRLLTDCFNHPEDSGPYSVFLTMFYEDGTEQKRTFSSIMDGTGVDLSVHHNGTEYVLSPCTNVLGSTANPAVHGGGSMLVFYKLFVRGQCVMGINYVGTTENAMPDALANKIVDCFYE